MSTTHYEINIHIDGRTMTPVKMYQFAMGLMAGNNDERPPNLHREFILARRQIRKLERKLRKAAGREKRLMRLKKWGIDGGLDKAKLILLEDGNVTEYELARWSLEVEIHTAHGKLARETTITARVGYDVVDDHAQCKCVVVENVNV